MTSADKGKRNAGHVEEELHDAVVRTRAVRGVASQFARQGVIRLLALVSMLVLARILTPEMFGIFAIAHFVVVFFNEFSTLGLAAALVRKKDAVQEIELRTVFALQMAIVTASFLLILYAAPLISAHYEFDESYDWLFRVIAVSLFLSSLKTVPNVILQRSLRHDLMAVSDVAEHIVYYGLAIILAYMGFEVWSLVYALLLRGVTGVFIVFYLTRWRPAFAFDGGVARDMLSFGIPIQLASLGQLANNAVVPVVIGSYLGAAAVGYVNFVRTILGALMFQPLIMMGKVQLRVFGRVQDDPVRLQRLVDKSLLVGGAITAYLGAMFIAQAEAFISVVVTDKWLPSLPLFYIGILGYVLFIIIVPYTQLLKALGDAMTPLISTVARFVVQVSLFILLFVDMGIHGFAWAMVLGIATTLLIVLARTRRHVSPAVFSSLLPSLVAALAAGPVSWYVLGLLGGWLGMLVAFVVGTLIYLLILGVLNGNRLSREIDLIADSVLPAKFNMRQLGHGMATMMRKLCLRSAS